MEVDYLSQNRSTSDNPRLALAHATKLVTDPEAEDKLIGIFGGVSSEESRAVQVYIPPCLIASSNNAVTIHD